MKVLFLLFFPLLFVSCKDEQKNWYVKQLALKVSILDSNTLFKLYPKDSINLGQYADKLIYYFDENKIIREMEYVIIDTNDRRDAHKYYISIGDIAWISSGQNIKNYFIDWPNGKTDSLYADYRKDQITPYKNSCGCGEPLQELKLNGKSFISKTDYDINGIYIFDR